MPGHDPVRDCEQVQALTVAARHTGYEGSGRAHDALEDCRMAAHVQRWCDEQGTGEAA